MNTPASYPHVKPLPTTGTLPATVRRFTASLGPNAYDDAYPVTWDVLIGGGFRVVDDTTERDGINNDWRKEGMQVYSVSDGKFYTLQSDLLSWTDTSPLLKSGGTVTGAVTLSANGALSAPAVSFTGTPITGGTTTTTKPLVLIETAGATSTGWTTSGTMVGVNAPSGFAGNLLDLQVNGSQKLNVTAGGSVVLAAGASFSASSTGDFRLNNDTILRRAAAANLALGAADAAAPVAQTIGVQNVVGGTTNTAGVTTTWRGSAGTGNAASGTLQFQLGTPTSSGTTQHAFSTGLTLANIGSAGVASHAATFAGTIRAAGYTVATLPTAGTAGRIAYVTDATAPTYRGALVGGGAVTCAVFDTGAAWVSI